MTARIILGSIALLIVGLFISYLFVRGAMRGQR